MYNRLANPEEAIPDAVRSGYAILCGDIYMLRDRWMNYEYLFGHSQARVDVLNRSAQTFFYMTAELLLEHFIIVFSRLAENSNEGQNLTLQSLIERSGIDPASEIGIKLHEDLARFREAVAAFKRHRNKRVAHMDMATAKDNGELLPLIARNDLKNALEAAEKFQGDFDYHFTQVTTLHDVMTMQYGADCLYTSLLKAEAYDALEAEEKIPRHTWHAYYK